MADRETDIRLDIFNTLLTTPHRELDNIYPLHAEMAEKDPRFYVRLAPWYADNGDVRDHKEMFTANLILSSFEGHRDVGLALLREFPPYQVCRVLDFIKGTVTKKKVTKKSLQEPEEQRPTRRDYTTSFLEDIQERLLRRADLIRAKGRGGSATHSAPSVEDSSASSEKQDDGFETVTEKKGLFRNPPRSMRTEIERYLREREADNDKLDNAIIFARRAMKRLYAVLHIPPSGRAQAILFDNDPPEDSKCFALKRVAKAEGPAEQARMIVKYRIPYRIASTVVKQMTPTVMVALINSMSSQELINNMASLKRHGCFDNPEVKSLIGEKLERAKTDNRVSAYKAKEAVKAAGVSKDIEEKLDDITQAQVKSKGRISRPTALLIDKSGSMEVAIELGKRIGAMVSTICERDLFVYAFDTVAYPIEVPGSELSDWEKSLAGINANGGTSCGVAIEWMKKKEQYVEQIIMITDEGENTNPRFVDALLEYRTKVKADPNVCFVKAGYAGDRLERECQQARIAADAFHFTGDYYALPNLLPLITRPSKLELLMEIMEYPLPQRKPV